MAIWGPIKGLNQGCHLQNRSNTTGVAHLQHTVAHVVDLRANFDLGRSEQSYARNSCSNAAACQGFLTVTVRFNLVFIRLKREDTQAASRHHAHIGHNAHHRNVVEALGSVNECFLRERQQYKTW